MTVIMTSSPTRETALRWLGLHPAYLDTETTGLDERAEICEIAVIDHEGRKLLDTLLKPKAPIPRAASDVHGIAEADVAEAQTLPDIWDHLVFLLAIKPLVIYNAAYALRLIRQSAAAWGLDAPAMRAGCAMKLYAEHHGEWDDSRNASR